MIWWLWWCFGSLRYGLRFKKDTGSFQQMTWKAVFGINPFRMICVFLQGIVFYRTTKSSPTLFDKWINSYQWVFAVHGEPAWHLQATNSHVSKTKWSNIKQTSLRDLGELERQEFSFASSSKDTCWDVTIVHADRIYCAAVLEMRQCYVLDFPYSIYVM